MRMNELVSFKHFELFREQCYINTRPSYIFRIASYFCMVEVFFFSSKVSKAFMNGKYSERCFLAEIKILVSPTCKSQPPGFSLKTGRR